MVCRIWIRDPEILKNDKLIDSVRRKGEPRYWSTDADLANYKLSLVELRKVMTLCRKMEYRKDWLPYDLLIKLIKDTVNILKPALGDEYNEDNSGIKNLVEILENLEPTLPEWTDHEGGSERSKLPIHPEDHVINRFMVLLFISKNEDYYPEISDYVKATYTYEFFSFMISQLSVRQGQRLKPSTVIGKVYEFIYGDSEEFFFKFLAGWRSSDDAAPRLFAREKDYNFMILFMKFFMYVIPEDLIRIISYGENSHGYEEETNDAVFSINRALTNDFSDELRLFRMSTTSKSLSPLFILVQSSFISKKAISLQ